MLRNATPVRLRLAQAVASVAPPMIAHLLTLRLYPYTRGQADGYTFSVASLTGSQLLGTTDEFHTHHFCIHRHYDWKMWVVAKTVCRAGDTVVEVGANVGTETIGFADIVGPSGHVHAFEPLPRNLELLRNNLSRSDLGNITIVPLAVSDRIGTIDFVPPPPGAHTGIGYIGRPVQSSPSSIQVQSTTLDSYLANTPARLLAMDVEGAEPSVLHGGAGWIDTHRPVIVLEATEELLHRSSTSRLELYEQLIGLGYEVHYIHRHKLTAPDLSATGRGGNWLAVHRSERSLARNISRAITLCGSLPPWKGLNPLVAHA